MRFRLVFLFALAPCVIACGNAETATTQPPVSSNSTPDRIETASVSVPAQESNTVATRATTVIGPRTKAPAEPGDTIEEAVATPEPAGQEVVNKAAAGPEPQDRIVVARFTTVQNGPPAGWVIDLKKGSHDFSVERDGNELVLHLVSKNNSFGIKKEAKVDVREYPYLNWRWKAVRMPPGGDVRSANTDDQAIQLYLAFPAMGWPAVLNSPVIGYVWDNEAPRGYYGRCRQIGGDKLRYMVLRNKSDKLGEWHAEKRNVYQDYKTLFKDIQSGEPSPTTHGIQIHINSQHTGTEAESYIGEIYFSRS